MTDLLNSRNELRDSIRRAATKLAHEVSDATEEAMEDAARALKHSAKDLGDRAATNSKLAARAMRKGVRAHPAAWISASVGAGLILGALMMWRRSSH